MTRDTITVLRSRARRLAKVIHPDCIQDYDLAKTVDLFEVPVADLDAVTELLGRLLARRDCCVVRGAIADPARTRGVRRLVYPDPDSGDQPTLRQAPHRWLALDMDGVERPERMAASDLPACGAVAAQRLPEAFHGARCIVQATAGHGIKPGCRVRLWYWLDRLTTDAELTRWLTGAAIDASVFRPAQPIYTAAPVFARGMQDHLPQRMAELPGAAAVAVPAASVLAPPERRAASRHSTLQTKLSNERAEEIKEAILARVRNAEDNAKHFTLRNAALQLGGIAEQAGIADSEAMRWLRDALPSSVKDWKCAEATAAWGMKKGRARPIDIPDKPRDPRRQETASLAFRLLRMGVPGDRIVVALQEQNRRRPEPLPSDVVANTALWAAQQPLERARAR